MKTADGVCAWALFGWGVVTIVRIEVVHPYGAVLDTPVLWLVTAILNLLRIRNEIGIRDLRLSCIAVNIIVLMIEIVRRKMFGSWTLIAALLVLFLTAFSIFRKPTTSCPNPNIPSR